MKFWEAMKALEDGKTVTPIEYPVPTNKKSLSDDINCSALTYWDEEWEIYEPPKPTYSFMEIVPMLKEGKRFARKTWHPSVSLGVSNKSETAIVQNSGYHTLCISDYQATDWVEV